MHHQVEGNGDTATTFSLGEIVSTWSRFLLNNISWQLLFKRLLLHWARVHSQAQCCHRHNEWTFLCPTFFVGAIFCETCFQDSLNTSVAQDKCQTSIWKPTYDNSYLDIFATHTRCLFVLLGFSHVKKKQFPKNSEQGRKNHEVPRNGFFSYGSSYHGISWLPDSFFCSPKMIPPMFWPGRAHLQHHHSL